MIYLSELKKWNRSYNLTALKTDKDIIIKHFLDSLLYTKAIPDGAIHLADAGTGAGFPGMPIKIIRPEIDMTLIESSRKKAAFLRHMIRLLKLSAVTVLEQRLEDLGREHDSLYDIIVSRATFSIKEFLEIACPYIREKGILILNKGPRVLEELRKMEENLHLRKSVKEFHKLQLPLEKVERYLIVLTCSDTRRK